MDTHPQSETPLELNLGVVTRDHDYLAVIDNSSIGSSGFNARLVAVADHSCPACGKYLEEKGVEVCESFRDLLTNERLNMILELTGDEAVMAEILRRKRPGVGVLDKVASIRLLDMVRQSFHNGNHEAELTQCKSFAATLLDASPDGVLIIDRNHQILDCNQSPLIIGAEDKKSIVGKKCFDVIYGAPCKCDFMRIGCPAEEARRTGKFARTVSEATTPDNTTHLFQVTAYPISDQTVITIRDISNALGERIEVRTEAIKKNLARVAQEDRLASLGRLVASVCHEINNPITSIVTFIKLIRSMVQTQQAEQTEKSEQTEKLCGKIEHYLDLSFKEAMRCGSIVKHLLTFARPRNVEAKLIDIGELVQSVLALTSHQFKFSEIVCEIDLSSSQLNAWGDFGLLQQVLLNLIFNAIDAMPKGGKLKISGGNNEEKDTVWLHVSDTGHGVDPEHLGRVFEPFFSTKADGKGVGLGLSMVYGIIRAHNGTIELESEPGKGATFKIELPRKPSVDSVGEKLSEPAFQASETFMPPIKGPNAVS